MKAEPLLAGPDQDERSDQLLLWSRTKEARLQGLLV